jgi:hypothetical protein
MQPREYFLIAGGLYGASLTYIWLRTPSGQITRKQYEASLPPLNRFFRRAAPAAFAAIPFVLLR